MKIFQMLLFFQIISIFMSVSHGQCLDYKTYWPKMISFDIFCIMTRPSYYTFFFKPSRVKQKYDPCGESRTFLFKYEQGSTRKKENWSWLKHLMCSAPRIKMEMNIHTFCSMQGHLNVTGTHKSWPGCCFSATCLGLLWPWGQAAEIQVHSGRQEGASKWRLERPPTEEH